MKIIEDLRKDIYKVFFFWNWPCSHLFVFSIECVYIQLNLPKKGEEKAYLKAPELEPKFSMLEGVVLYHLSHTKWGDIYKVNNTYFSSLPF